MQAFSFFLSTGLYSESNSFIIGVIIGAVTVALLFVGFMLTLRLWHKRKQRRIRLEKIQRDIAARYVCHSSIRESVDSLCRDGMDTPMARYIGKAFTRTNVEDISLFKYLIMVYE